MAQPEKNQQNGAHSQATTTEVTERSSRKDLALLARVLGIPLITASGMIGLVVGYELGEKENKDRLNDIFGKPLQRTFNPNSLNAQPEAESAIDNLGLNIQIFNQRTDYLNASFFEFAARPKSDETLAIFHQMAIEHLFEGFKILNQAKKKMVTSHIVDRQKLLVELENQVFDLNDPWQFQMAFALTSLKLDAINKDSNLSSSNSEETKKTLLAEKVKISLDQEAILWLKDQPLKIGFTKNSILLVNPESLARFARTLKLVNQLGYPIPRTGIFGPNKIAGGRFVGKSELSRYHTIIDYSDPHGSVDSLVHELGHYVAQSPDINPQFSQQAFNRLMNQIEAANLPHVADKNIHYYVPTDYRNSREEQYAYFFAEYVTNGDRLKAYIAEIRKRDSFTANILETEYEFFKRGFGQEFVRETLTANELRLPQQEPTPQATEIKPAYQIGQQTTIDDKDVKYPGVFLRGSPAGSITVETRAVFDGDRVEIVEGPFITKRQAWNQQGSPFLQEVKWWKVKVTFRDVVGYAKVRNQDGEGWIEEKYLGRVYKN